MRSAFMHPSLKCHVHARLSFHKMNIDNKVKEVETKCIYSKVVPTTNDIGD